MEIKNKNKQKKEEVKRPFSLWMLADLKPIRLITDGDISQKI